MADLRLVVKDAAGKVTAIPAQFRVLARWVRGDNSIRWVLVDFASANVPGEKKVVYLTDAKLDAGQPGQPGQPTTRAEAAAEEGADAIVVSTGLAKFTVNKKKFNLLQSAVVEGQELLDSSADVGTVIEDILGEKYYSSEGTKSVEVLENGPVRVCVRARGQHMARGGKGYSRGMYGYDIFMNFYAGSTEVGLDVIVTNNFAKSIGEPLMKDASLLIKLAGGATGCRVHGAAPLDAPLAAGTSVSLYQDSNGGETWQTCQGYTGDAAPGGTCFRAKVTSFRGYRIYKHADGKDEQIGGGDQARGLMRISNDRGGVVMLMRNFWQQFPKAVEAAGDGTLRLGMFPRETVVPHYLDDTAAKGHEVVLHFYAKGKGKPRYATDPEGRTWPHVFADIWDVPALPRPTIEHIAATGALSDIGPFTVPTVGLTDYDTAVNLRRLFMTDEYWGNCLGWQVYGERWKSHGGHSTHGARQPIEEEHFLRSWYWTGGPGWLDAGINRSRQFRDVRCYRVDDTDALAYAGWAEFRKNNVSENGHCSRPVPKDDELKKYQEGMIRHARWEFPNPEHCTLDLLYDRYLLLGDQRAYENMRVVAGHGGFFAIGTAPKPGAEKVGNSLGRSQGWSWRALERYWELTGDKRADELLKLTIKSYEPLIGKAPLWFADDRLAHASDWFTQIFSRAAAMTALHTGDAKALEICKELAKGKSEPWAGSITYGKQQAKDASQFSALFAVIYHLTGDEHYKDAVIKPGGGQKYLTASGGSYFLPSDHWLMSHPPK